MRAARIIVPALTLFLAVPSVSTSQVVDADRAGPASSEIAPSIDLWLDQPSYNRGNRMRPHFSTEPGVYVVIGRVTPKGELAVMYPLWPGSQKPYALGRYPDDRIPYSESGLYETGGLGMVFAIASYEPFDFSAFRDGPSWSNDRLRKFGRFDDPFAAVSSFADKILPNKPNYSLDSEFYELYSPRGASKNVYQGDFGYISRDPAKR